MQKTFPRRAAVALALLALTSLALVAAGCGSDSSSSGVAQAPTTSTDTQSSQSGGSQAGSTSGNAAAFASCMRSHGVPKFPDPDSEGHFYFKMGPGTGIDPESPQFRAAGQACRKLQPPERAPSPAEIAANREEMLEFAACMRSNGVPKFPDPNSSDGGIKLSRQSGIDPNSPQFKAAEQACEELLPGTLGTTPNQQ
jgi:hypothetical protein